MPVSRTKRTIQNSKVSLILFLIQILVGFYSRKIFLEYLGDEIIGLNTTLGNILSFLNLAELGIGMAMATSLFKPLHDEDYETISEIITVQGILYKRIAILLCGLSIPILIAIPYIFQSTECSLIYIYIAYIVFLSGSIFSYLWNYRQVLIEADQKNFKLVPWTHAVRYTKLILQIGLFFYTSWGVWGWISIEFAGNVATIFVINSVIHKEYPWFHDSKKSEKLLLQKYKHLLTKTKQLFIHKIAGFVLYQTSPLVIFAFVSLNIVTYYGNYMMIIGYCTTLMNVVFGGMTASIGNLIADNNKQHTMDVFWELFTSRIWIGGIACFTMYICIGPFISLWIGEKYLLGETTLLLMVLYMFIQISRSVIESFKDAYQFFGDVWAPVIEASINLGGSILFGYLWGLNGVLIGVNLSLILVVLLWRPFYIFHRCLKDSATPYYTQYAFHVIVLVIVAYATKLFTAHFLYENRNIISMIIILLTGIILYILTTYTILYLTTKGMRLFTNRIKSILRINKI